MENVQNLGTVLITNMNVTPSNVYDILQRNFLKAGAGVSSLSHK
jgi:hypothetical protein